MSCGLGATGKHEFSHAVDTEVKTLYIPVIASGLPGCTEFIKDLIVKSTQQQTNYLPRPAGQMAFACALTVRHAAQIVRASKQVPALEPETNGFSDRGWYPGSGDV